MSRRGITIGVTGAIVVAAITFGIVLLADDDGSVVRVGERPSDSSQSLKQEEDLEQDVADLQREVRRRLRQGVVEELTGFADPPKTTAQDFSRVRTPGYHTSPRRRFEIDRIACADFSQDSLARQVEAPPDAGPGQIASAYRRYLHLDAPAEILAAVEAGCLAGILSRSPVG